MSIARTILTPHDAININAGANTTSVQQDIGSNAIAGQIWLYLEISAWAGTPLGNQRFAVSIWPRHTTGGSDFDDDALQLWFSTTANQAYRFGVPLNSLPEFFVVDLLNDTTQNATGITLKIEFQKIT